MPEQSSRPEQPSRPHGRLRSAWRVLRGEALVPDQILAEWAEYQLTFNDLLQRFSALLARQAKSERKRLSRSLEEPPSQPQLELTPSGRSSSKALLRSAAADRLGLGPLRQKLKSSQPHQAEESAG